MTDDQRQKVSREMEAILMRNEAIKHRNRIIMAAIEDRHQKAMERIQTPSTPKTCPTCGKEL